MTHKISEHLILTTHPWGLLPRTLMELPLFFFSLDCIKYLLTLLLRCDCNKGIWPRTTRTTRYLEYSRNTWYRKWTHLEAHFRRESGKLCQISGTGPNFIMSQFFLHVFSACNACPSPGRGCARGYYGMECSCSSVPVEVFRTWHPIPGCYYYFRGGFISGDTLVGFGQKGAHSSMQWQITQLYYNPSVRDAISHPSRLFN